MPLSLNPYSQNYAHTAMRLNQCLLGPCICLESQLRKFRFYKILNFAVQNLYGKEHILVQLDDQPIFPKQLKTNDISIIGFNIKVIENLAKLFSLIQQNIIVLCWQHILGHIVNFFKLLQ